MQSFRTELENPLVEKDILELEQKIRLYREGQVPEDKFKSLRLARGVYGQRQQGVQMVRIKLPFGKMNWKQIKRIADISDEYATSNLHLTTRQDIQIHFVSLDRTPELWEKLAKDDITIREACGNTVRNITGSPTAGIDPKEPFDITPYADAAFRYFLRNPICQDMGRKFKMSFSSSDDDTAFAFMHDIGVIPKVRMVDGKEQRGFKVMVGGGLGAQPFLAQEAFEFLEEDLLIPYVEAVLRVFDRNGERASRNKARMKYLLKDIGLEEFMRLVKEEWTGLKSQHYKVDINAVKNEPNEAAFELPAYEIKNREQFEAWKKTNVFEQKQKGYLAAYIKIILGNIPSDTARLMADKLAPLTSDDVRITVNQGLLLRFIKPEHLEYIYSVLEEINFSEAGFDSVSDITACPGTDTCNLGISNSTGIAAVFEGVIKKEYPDLIYNNDIKVKISGCMNSCGQHGMANIGFHGSSLRKSKQVLPALQVLLGGGRLGDGHGRIADKVVKVPSKKGPEVLRAILEDYKANSNEGEYFNDYYDRQGNKYFYALIKPIADLDTLVPSDFIDWGKDEQFVPAIGVGECAGVQIDLVATLILEAEEKLQDAAQNLDQQAYADGIYQSYSALVYTAKALLLDKDVKCNTQAGIIRDFDKHYVDTGDFNLSDSFSDIVLQMKKNEPTADFAKSYYETAKAFWKKAKAFREASVAAEEQ